MHIKLLLPFVLCAWPNPTVQVVPIGVPVPVDSFDGNDKLIFLQTIWRHGARTPVVTFPADKNKWDRGLGELTVKGMGMHVVLGQRLKARYTDKLNFTNHAYKSKEIYVRSTDYNRTILSAISNMIGFYKGVPGVDYPNIPLWPQQFVPVPIHTPVNVDRDYVGVTVDTCDRQNVLMEMVYKTPEMQKTYDENKKLLKILSNITNKQIDLTNLWSIYDAWYIDRYNNRTLPPDFTDELYEETTKLSNKLINFYFGVGIQPFKNVDLRYELTKINGGPLLWSLIRHMEEKIYCESTLDKDQDATQKKLCGWMKPLKYYAYSAHDTTIAALFAAFDFNETNFNEPGFPHYSACVSAELWQQRDMKYYLKFYYWIPSNETEEDSQSKFFIDLTKFISGCTDKCLWEAFVKRSSKYRITESNEEFCKKTHILNGAGSTLSVSTTLNIFLNLLVAISMTSLLNYS